MLVKCNSYPTVALTDSKYYQYLRKLQLNFQMSNQRSFPKSTYVFIIDTLIKYIRIFSYLTYPKTMRRSRIFWKWYAMVYYIQIPKSHRKGSLGSNLMCLKTQEEPCNAKKTSRKMNWSLFFFIQSSVLSIVFLWL